MKFIFDRMREPSTWAGLSAIAVLLGIPQESFNAVAQAVVAVAGAAAVLMPERR